jgi:hypothetical protein
MKSSSAVGRGRASRARKTFLADVLAGLRESPKRLPCKYFYDKRGSELFEQICQLEEYYLTRCELTIMEWHAGEMGEQIGPGVMLVEYGSGSSVKTRYLLDGLPGAAAYVPVDISGEHLLETAQELARDYPRVEILPVCADFTRDFALRARSPLPLPVSPSINVVASEGPTRSNRDRISSSSGLRVTIPWSFAEPRSRPRRAEFSRANFWRCSSKIDMATWLASTAMRLISRCLNAP